MREGAGGREAGSGGRREGKGDGETSGERGTGDRSRGQSLGQGSRGKREAATTGSCRSPSLEGTGVSSLKEEGLVIAGRARGLRALAAP